MVVIVIASMVTSAATLFTVFADKYGTTVELGVLEFADGAGGFLGFLVDDDATAFGAAVVSFENIGLKFRIRVKFTCECKR